MNNMKSFANLLIIAVILIAFSCKSDAPKQKGDQDAKVKHTADTGYTGVRSYMSGEYKVKEVEFKNGLRSGITRTYYKGGIVKNEIPYENNVKSGEAKWYYPDGKLFRITPYSKDTINGPQVQYYKDGRVKAKINYIEGKREPVLAEFDMNGVKITGYPEITYRIIDNYKERGVYKIFIEMSDLSENVKYYRGDYVNGLVDLSVCTPLLQNATTGYLDMTKGEVNSKDSVSIIASYLTNYGNRLYYRIAVPLPYNDLK